MLGPRSRGLRAPLGAQTIKLVGSIELIRPGKNTEASLRKASITILIFISVDGQPYSSLKLVDSNLIESDLLYFPANSLDTQGTRERIELDSNIHQMVYCGP